MYLCRYTRKNSVFLKFKQDKPSGQTVHFPNYRAKRKYTPSGWRAIAKKEMPNYKNSLLTLSVSTSLFRRECLALKLK